MKTPEGRPERAAMRKDKSTTARARAGTVTEAEPVLVVDFGAQYAQLIARRVREAHVYSEIIPHTSTIDDILARRPRALILSGGPQSVYEDGAPAIDPKLFDAGVPILGICYGYQAMAKALGGSVARTASSESGPAKADVDASSALFAGQPAVQRVWMSHSDSVKEAPPGFKVSATTGGGGIAAFENVERDLYGVQWHPEVIQSEQGNCLFRQFLHEIAHLNATWTAASFIEQAIEQIRATVKRRHVICGLSGGVDSAVAAALVHRAIGDQLTCVFVDHGLLREGERQQVVRDGCAATGKEPQVVDARERFLSALAGKTDPEAKRKTIGLLFIRVFEEFAQDLAAKDDQIEFLVQGTLYPDLVESGRGSGAETIKSHHNVGGLPLDHQFQLIEPLSSLFKDEVRAVGVELGLPDGIVWRQPFPGPGLAIRIMGAVTNDRLSTLRHADAIVREELSRAQLDRVIWQCPVVLVADTKTVGVKGDRRTYQHPIVIRPVTSDDGMTADWVRVPYDVLESISTRVTNEVEGVSRVLVDVTSKPPASIEWE